MPTLHWLSRDKDISASSQAPYRLLDAVETYGDNPDTQNMVIQGDNLDALKALLPFYAGKIKCIYMDPPYNTRSAFEHYDDNLEHTTWLSILYPRLEIARDLLSQDGSLWISVDDNEAHYLKIILDEVFGRKNFVFTMIWQQRTTRENRKVFSNNHEYVMLCAKDIGAFSASRNDLDLTEQVKSRYKNLDDDPRGPWQSVSANAQAGHGTKEQFYTLVAPNGKKHDPPTGRCWLYTKPKMMEKIANNEIWFGKTGNNVPRVKKYLSEAKAGLTPETLWFADDVGTNDKAKKHIVSLFPEKDKKDVFETPKPEQLLQRIIHIASNPGDTILDPFLGSGTTAATAHKMGRHYIGIEMGEHADSYCVPRLNKVINGEQGGISTEVGWEGGGAFRYYHLGSSVFDDDGKINSSIRFPALAAHIWFCEAKTPYTGKANSPFLGVHNGVAYYLLFNGILGDKTVNGGNVLTTPILKSLPPHDGPKVIYGEGCRFGGVRLKKEQITFKHIPYDIKAR